MKRTTALCVACACLLLACTKGTPESAPSLEPALPALPETPPAPPEAPSPPAEPVEVVLWHAYRAGEKAALEQVVSSINAESTLVKIRSQSVPYDPFVDKITITIPRGQGPDLFIFAHNMIGAWVEDNLIEPIGSAIEPAELDAFIPNTVRPLVYRNNLYGLPLAFKSLVLFYNKKWLAEAPATMEALLTTVKGIQKPAEGLHGLVYEAGLLYNHAPWMSAFGGRVFDDEGRPAFHTEAQAKALSFAQALHVEHKVLPKGITGFMVTSLFNEGKAVAVLQGPWFRAEIADGVDYGVATIPSVAGAVARPFVGIEAVFVSRKSAHKKAAIEAARRLVDASSAQVRMTVGKQPVAHGATLRAGATQDPALLVFLEQAERGVPMPSRPEMQLVWSTIDMAIQGVVFGGRAPEKVLAKAQAKLVEDIGKRGR